MYNYILEEKPELFTCCLPIQKSNILIGSDKGVIYKGRLKSIDEIQNFKFSNETLINVLEDNLQIVHRFSSFSVVRSIQNLYSENIIFLSDLGGIVIFNYSTKNVSVIQTENQGKYNKTWRLLVIDENYFVTIGNYSQIFLWIRRNSEFFPIMVSKKGHALFCVDWLDYDKKLFFTNDFKGLTTIWQFENDHINEISSFQLDGNLQKSIVFNQNYLIATDYYGSILIYKLKDSNFEKIEEFSISWRTGNYVYFSNEIDMILVGTDGNLIILDKHLIDVFALNIEVKQIFSVDNIDLILTSKYIVRPNYNKKKIPPELHKYKYIKIGLVGDSQVGKTCFCKFLETSKFEETESSFGKHIWTIPLQKEDRRILLYDLAGQEAELFTYFPMIQDANIILLFYQAIKPGTFNQVIRYYNELRKKCHNAEFYFVQTFSEQRQRVLNSHIKEEFDELGIDFEKNLIKISSKNGLGFDDFYQKVISNINWDDAPIKTNLKVHDIIENKIHELYISGVTSINIESLLEEINIDKLRLEKIIDSYYNQGNVVYIADEKELIINDEDYEILHTEIAEYIGQKYGYVSTIELLKELGKIQKTRKYVKNILQYYKNNGIGIFFRENDEKNEKLIFLRDLRSSLKVPKEYQNFLPPYETKFIYNDEDLQIDTLINFFSQFPLELITISTEELLFQIEQDMRNKNTSILLQAKLRKIDDQNLIEISFGMSKVSRSDYEMEEIIINQFLNNWGKNLINLGFDERKDSNVLTYELNDQIKSIFKLPYERPYVDFKLILLLDEKYEKAEMIKDIIALANSSYINNDYSYLIIGVKQEHNKVLGFNNVSNSDSIEQIITQLTQYLNKIPVIKCSLIRIRELLLWKESYEISGDIPFTEEQTHSDNNEHIFVIEIIREKGCVYELNQDFQFKNKKGNLNGYYKGNSWIRIGSHTYNLQENQREILRNR